MNAGIYIHVPFCLRKCFYCDFFSYEAKEHSAFESYTHEVVAELENLQINKIDTVYIGGGTPTALPSFLLCKILHEISQLPLAHDAEITVEANPGTIDAKYLAELNARGVNRLSIGLQTTHSDLLKTLGRIHSVQDFKENFHSARDAGFKNISVDLMFGLPSQTQTKWRETLEEIIELSPEHISAYSLTPAENTPLWEQIESGKIVLPGDTIDREMYHMARKILAEAGYEQYELSNFAKHGF
ncbi:MAG: radical SAM family heme chaperone HemW, partial [Defluviitaleaceae bacterium]|nr:radical SAM family heme chaperone HemW [Defluviitaleaceae bacterium]